MKREEYLIQRNKNMVDINLAYEYYSKKVVKDILPFNEFGLFFDEWLVEIKPNLCNFFAYHDQLYNVFKLTHTNGSFYYL